jgi:hypothetical protein
VGGAFGQKMVMPDQRMLEQVRDMVNKMDMKSDPILNELPDQPGDQWDRLHFLCPLHTVWLQSVRLVHI